MKSTSPIQIVKNPETFFPVITKYFQENGVVNYLQAKFLVEIAREVQVSKKRQLNPMKSKLIKKGVSSEFAMQFVLQYLLKKNLKITVNCGQIELPNTFNVYQTTSTISNKFKLKNPPSEWLSEVLCDYKEKKFQNPSNNQKNDNLSPIMLNPQEESFDIDFDSDESKDTNNTTKNEIENSKSANLINVFEEEEEYSDNVIALQPFKKKKLVANSNDILNKSKPILNDDFDFDSNSS